MTDVETSELTAGEQEILDSMVASHQQENDDVIMIRFGAMKAYVAAATRKAFEKAADKAPELVKLMDNEGLFHGPYASGYKTADEASSVAVAVLDAALRALAKEPQL